MFVEPALAPRPASSSSPVTDECLNLRPFERSCADQIVSWVRSPLELTWLAPGTPPPLTAEKVLTWSSVRGRRFMLWMEANEFGASQPAGHAELNSMDGDPRRLWIGHFIIAPAHRSRSIGARFARMLLEAGFALEGIEEILLVALVDNTRAVRCYERAGFVVTGRESKYFPVTRERHEFVRMAIHRTRYEQLRPLNHFVARSQP